MPLLFTNPALLLGALGAALPVIIHFLSRRRVQKQPFSDLRFLDEVHARQARSMGIRRWLILLLRVLAILLLVLGTAGPRWGGVSSSFTGGRAVLFVLDTSASMNTQTGDGTRLDQAVDRCAAMISALPAGAWVQVIEAGGRTQALFGDWLPAGPGAVQGLEAVTPTDGAFGLDQVLAVAAGQVSRAPQAQVEMIWLSDLQPLTGDEAVRRAATRLKDSGTVHHLLRPVGQTAVGGGVLGARLPGRALQAGQSIPLEASLTTAFAEETVVLEVDGRPVAEAVVPGVAAEPVSVTFPLTVPDAGLHRGLVRRQSDAFPMDDSRPFALKVAATINVLLVHGPDRAVDSSAGRGGWRLLEAALAPAGAPGLFRVNPVSSDRLAEGDLARHELVVLVNPEPLGRRAQEALRQYLDLGGGLLVLLGEPSQAQYYQETLLPLLGFSGQPAWHGDGAAGGQEGFQRLALTDPSHPVFQGLEADALGTLEDVRWRHWFSLAEGEARVLLQVTDESPLLLERDQGQGLVALMPTDLSPAATDFPTSSMALPFFQRLGEWLAGARALGPAATVPVGSELTISPLGGTDRDDLERSEELLVWYPGEERARPAELSWRGGRPVLTGGVARRAGFHVFTVAGDTVGLVAATVPDQESETRLWTAQRWEQEMAAWGVELSALLEGPGAGDLDEKLVGRSLAAWFYLAAQLVLLLELFLARRAGPGQASG